MDVLKLNLTGPIIVTKDLPRGEGKLHTVCYWDGTDALVQLVNTGGIKVPFGPNFLSGDIIEVEDEGYRTVGFLEPFTLGPCAIESIWLGQIGVSQRGWSGWRYLLEK